MKLTFQILTVAHARAPYSDKLVRHKPPSNTEAYTDVSVFKATCL